MSIRSFIKTYSLYIEDYPFIIRFKTHLPTSRHNIHYNIEDYPFIIRFKTQTNSQSNNLQAFTYWRLSIYNKV